MISTQLAPWPMFLVTDPPRVILSMNVPIKHLQLHCHYDWWHMSIYSKSIFPSKLISSIPIKIIFLSKSIGYIPIKYYKFTSYLTKFTHQLITQPPSFTVFHPRWDRRPSSQSGATGGGAMRRPGVVKTRCRWARKSEILSEIYSDFPKFFCKGLDVLLDSSEVFHSAVRRFRGW